LEFPTLDFVQGKGYSVFSCWNFIRNYSSWGQRLPWPEANSGESTEKKCPPLWCFRQPDSTGKQQQLGRPTPTCSEENIFCE